MWGRFVIQYVQSHIMTFFNSFVTIRIVFINNSNSFEI